MNPPHLSTLLFALTLLLPVAQPYHPLYPLEGYSSPADPSETHPPSHPEEDQPPPSLPPPTGIHEEDYFGSDGYKYVTPSPRAQETRKARKAAAAAAQKEKQKDKEEANKDKKESNKDKKEANQDKKEANKDKKEANQDKKEANQDKKEANQDKKEANQDKEAEENHKTTTTTATTTPFSNPKESHYAVDTNVLHYPFPDGAALPVVAPGAAGDEDMEEMDLFSDLTLESAAPYFPPLPRARGGRNREAGRVRAKTIYEYLEDIIHERLRRCSRRCKCWGYDIWLGSLPGEASGWVTGKSYRRILQETHLQMRDRLDMCGCSMYVVCRHLPESVLARHVKDEEYIVYEDVYRELQWVDRMIRKSVGLCCYAKQGNVNGYEKKIYAVL